MGFLVMSAALIRTVNAKTLSFSKVGYLEVTGEDKPEVNGTYLFIGNRVPEGVIDFGTAGMPPCSTVYVQSPPKDDAVRFIRATVSFGAPAYTIYENSNNDDVYKEDGTQILYWWGKQHDGGKASRRSGNFDCTITA